MEHPVMGRPRDFDQERVIDSAMRVFWEKSYEGATMADLTEATGLNRSSIHAAFGSKEGLFLKVVERHWEGPMAYIPEGTRRTYSAARG
jgi:AcrR family transcriptional regulator